MSRYQLVINWSSKTGAAKAIQQRDIITSYANVAREMIATGATLPLSVWQHWSTGTQLYDGARTSKLSTAIIGYLKDPRS